jgi:hypothetical protein
MKYILFILALSQAMVMTTLRAQSSDDERCRLTMVIPEHFVSAGTQDNVISYRSKRGRTTLSMSRYNKDSQEGYMNAQSAADRTYKDLKETGIAIEMNVVNEAVGKTSFTIVSWVIPSLKKGFEPHMIAFNDECDILYRFSMTSSTSNKKELDKAFRSFLRTCKRSKSK